MGLLKNIFSSRASAAAVTHLPSGSITVDRTGKIVSSTVSSAYPEALLHTVSKEVLALLREAHAAQMPIAEVSIHFAVLRITARELRGGAIIFLFPQTALSPISN
ncbi:MAG: hypothetical protein ABSE90_01345 [Verrucomicrobiota bacterium]